MDAGFGAAYRRDHSCNSLEHGTILAGFAKTLPMLYLTYGIIAGIGLGLGYTVPIAVLIKWFPDKRGLITGIAVAGFGTGALITAPVAHSLIRSYGVGPTWRRQALQVRSSPFVKHSAAGNGTRFGQRCF